MWRQCNGYYLDGPKVLRISQYESTLAISSINLHLLKKLILIVMPQNPVILDATYYVKGISRLQAYSPCRGDRNMLAKCRSCPVVTHHPNWTCRLTMMNVDVKRVNRNWSTPQTHTSVNHHCTCILQIVSS